MSHAINYRRDLLMRTPQRSRVVIRQWDVRAVRPLNSVTSNSISMFRVFIHSPSRTSRMLKITRHTAISNTADTWSINLYKKLEEVFCIEMIQMTSGKNSQPIKSRNFGHMHSSFLCGIFGATNLYKKKLTQESMTDVKVSCASWLTSIFLYVWRGH